MKIDLGVIMTVGSCMHEIYHAITGKRCAFNVFTPTTEKPELPIRDKASPGDEKISDG